MLEKNTANQGLRAGSAGNICGILRQPPQGTAIVRGNSAYPGISGKVMFYQMKNGVLVAAEIFGLPQEEGPCDGPIFGFHIHGGGLCSGTKEDPFADTGTHYDPSSCEHPYHAGDLPPLFGNRGYAFTVFLTDRFKVRDIIGKTIVIHSMPDDFTTQLAGNAGAKIACGQILGREARR